MREQLNGTWVLMQYTKGFIIATNPLLQSFFKFYPLGKPVKYRKSFILPCFSENL